MLRALITGITGFAGSYLTEQLAASGEVDIHGVHRPDDGQTAHGVIPAEIPGVTTLHLGDLTDRAFVFAAVAAARPDLVFHLAAQASVAAAWSDPAATIVNNVVAEINLLEAIARHAPAARVLIVGSAEEYGLVRPNELPIGENQPFRPNNPYAVSKVTQDLLGYQYFVSHRLATVRVRPFNHLGPRQREAFVTAAFARQVAEAEIGLADAVVRVGNLEARRDFTDVRDVVAAYWLALTRGEPGDVYNVASGSAVSIREVLDRLIALSCRKLEITTDPSRLRPSDIPELVGDASKLRQRTGWAPRFSLDHTLRDTLDFWRERVRLRVR